MKAILIVLSASAYLAHAVVTLPDVNTRVPVRDWYSMQGEGVVKQDYDYSCGAASLATILNSYYGMNLSELQLLDAMEQEDDKASFAELSKVLKLYDFKGVGLALSFEQLQSIQVPPVVYLEHRGQPHFSVLKGIGSDGRVALADPAWGNRILLKSQFMKMWRTRNHETLVGKVLVVIPNNAAPASRSSFFAPPERGRYLHNLPTRTPRY